MGISENGEKIDPITPANEHSKEVFEAAFPNYDKYDGTSFTFRLPREEDQVRAGADGVPQRPPARIA